MDNIFAREKWFPSQDLSKDAAYTPYVNCRSVLQVNIKIEGRKGEKIWVKVNMHNINLYSAFYNNNNTKEKEKKNCPNLWHIHILQISHHEILTNGCGKLLIL